jgi:hypothetical protein
VQLQDEIDRCICARCSRRMSLLEKMTGEEERQNRFVENKTKQRERKKTDIIHEEGTHPDHTMSQGQ